MIPFSGTAGWCLNTALSWAGLSREECLVANVCQHRPSASSNDFDALDWDGEEVQGGIAQLLADLTVFRPNVVVCLGNVPLHLFRNGNVAPPRAGAKGEKKGAVKWPSKVSSWRGSLFNSSPLLSVAAAGVVATDTQTFSSPAHPHELPYSTTPPRAGETLPPTAPSLLVGDEGGVVEKSAPMPGAREGASVASAGLPLLLSPLVGFSRPADNDEAEYSASTLKVPSNDADSLKKATAVGLGAKEALTPPTCASTEPSPFTLPAVPVLAEPPRNNSERQPTSGEAQESTQMLATCEAAGCATSSKPRTLAAAGPLAGDSVQGPLEGVGRSMDRACIPPPLLPAILGSEVRECLTPTGVALGTLPQGSGPLTALSTYTQADLVNAINRLGKEHLAKLGWPVDDILNAVPRWKCLSTWHPAFVLRSWSAMFDLRQDLTRARLEAGDPSLTLPRLVLEWGPDPLLNA